MMAKVQNYKSTFKNKKKIYFSVKRSIDIVISFFSLIILFPIFLIISIAIKIDSKGSVIFKQERYGINKTTFYIYKFRTMSTCAPENVATRDLHDSHKYITKLGRFLRKTSLDELPQLINILMGQMSIIGPRPVILAEYDLIEERDKYGANDVKPGLTGWAQINGRDELDNKTKARYDGEYVKNIGFRMDFKCFLKTILLVFKRDGIKEGCTGFEQNFANDYDVERVSSKV